LNVVAIILVREAWAIGTLVAISEQPIRATGQPQHACLKMAASRAMVRLSCVPSLIRVPCCTERSVVGELAGSIQVRVATAMSGFNRYSSGPPKPGLSSPSDIAGSR
jgi:hypothetical protein